ncbi:MAG: LemA family protein [Clostridioides sp.]|jgi:LemA protein|nr:LemA family protein [Clostridioides sp.]
MKNGTKILIGVLVVVLIIGGGIAGSYNKLTGMNQNVNKAQANIDTLLQRRMDLIPNLVSTVKGYATQEKSIFTDIANARAKLAGAGNVKEQASADTELSGALSRLLVVVEKYPDLKSNKNFQDLSVQLEGSENRIAIARQDYNAAVTEFNTKILKFPTNIFASMFGFKERDLYKAGPGADEVPKVDFGN